MIDTSAWTPPILHPETYEDAAQNLRHTLDVFGADEPGDRMVLMATSNVYGSRVRTGITFADLRLIAEALHRLEGLDK